MPLGDPGERCLSVMLDFLFLFFLIFPCRIAGRVLSQLHTSNGMGQLYGHLGVQCLVLKGMLAEL